VETQVKERLTGAIVLVGVLVFLVPELLTGPKGGSRAPAQSAPQGTMRSYTIDLTEAAESRQATAPVPDAPAESLSPDDEQVSEGADAAQGETDGMSDAEASGALGEESEARVANGASPSPDVVASAAPTASASPAAQPDSAQAGAEAKPAPQPGSKTASPQPATGQSADTKPTNTDATAAKPDASRVSSAESISKPPPPKPADTEAKATQAANGKPTATTKTAAPEQPVPQKTSAAKPTSDKGWSVQVGSFASRANADRLASRLQSKGFKAFVTQATGSPRLYRVRVGPQADRPAAQAMATRLKAAGHPGTLVASP
jgi:DedD protein